MVVAEATTGESTVEVTKSPHLKSKIMVKADTGRKCLTWFQTGSIQIKNDRPFTLQWAGPVGVKERQNTFVEDLHV